MNKWHEIIATFFYVGKLPKIPGTCGTVAGLVLIGLLSVLGFWKTFLFQVIFIVLILLAGIFSSSAVAKQSMLHDPQIVVIDEVLGILVAMFAVPLSFQTLLLGFILFRIFDIWKPYPIRNLEALPNGWGIMLDDLAAGICANVILRLLKNFIL